ncbi:four helix bundle protein, partial [Myxococcota bacterium]|nr:four helix bundle protein [Myxococcota bacterium]
MCSRKAKHTQDGVAFFCKAKNADHSAAVIKLTPHIRKSSRELADQLSRAAISITCNLSEGSGR